MDNQGNVTPEWYSYFAQLQKLLGGPTDPFTDVTLSSGGGAVAVAQLAISQQIGPLGSFPPPPPRTITPVAEGGTGLVTLAAGAVPMGDGNNPWRASNISQDTSGNLSVGIVALRVALTASAVNYFDLFGAPTTFGPSLRARGSDTNIPIAFDTKGTGNFDFTAGSFARFVFRVFGSAGNDYYTITPVTGAPVFSVAGSSTNANASIAPKGTGFVNATINGFSVGGTQVVGARQTGFAAWTGSGDAGTVFDPSTVTLPQLAARVLSVQLALTNHGLIGA